MAGFEQFQPSSSHGATAESASLALSREAFSLSQPVNAPYSLKSDGLAGSNFSQSDDATRDAAAAFHAGWAVSSNFYLTTRPFAVAVAGVGIAGAVEDIKALTHSHTAAEKTRFGVSLVGDVATAAGGLAVLAPEMRVAGRIAIGVGTLLNIAADYIPYRMVRDK